MVAVDVLGELGVHISCFKLSAKGGAAFHFRVPTVCYNLNSNPILYFQKRPVIDVYNTHTHIITPVKTLSHHDNVTSLKPLKYVV